MFDGSERLGWRRRGKRSVRIFDRFVSFLLFWLMCRSYYFRSFSSFFGQLSADLRVLCTDHNSITSLRCSFTRSMSCHWICSTSSSSLLRPPLDFSVRFHFFVRLSRVKTSFLYDYTPFICLKQNKTRNHMMLLSCRISFSINTESVTTAFVPFSIPNQRKSQRT